MGQQSIKLAIDTTDRSLAFDIMGAANLSVDASVEIESGLRVIYKGSIVRKAEGIPETVQFLIEFAPGFPIAVLSGLASA